MATAPDSTLAPMPEISIRPMSEADVPAVIAIERAAYQFPWSETIFRDCVRVGYLCRLVESGTLAIGYGVMSMGAGEAHVLNLCIRPEYRSVGIGRRVLEHLIERARLAQMRDVYLEVRPSNITAIRLYQAVGFEPIGVRRGYYQAVGGREDAAVLKLELLPHS
jgi:ribosomal-protein-alanine N-acetyltransferase